MGMDNLADDLKRKQQKNGRLAIKNNEAFVNNTITSMQIPRKRK